MTQKLGYSQLVYEQEAYRIPDEISRMLAKVRQHAEDNEEALDWAMLRITTERYAYLGAIEIRVGVETKP